MAGRAPLPPPTWGSVRLGVPPNAEAPKHNPAGRPREVPGDAALARRLQAEEQQGLAPASGSPGTWADGDNPTAAPSWGASAGASRAASWDASGGGASGWGGDASGEAWVQDGGGEAWEDHHTAPPDTSEDAALAARLQVPPHSIQALVPTQHQLCIYSSTLHQSQAWA